AGSDGALTGVGEEPWRVLYASQEGAPEAVGVAVEAVGVGYGWQGLPAGGQAKRRAELRPGGPPGTRSGPRRGGRSIRCQLSGRDRAGERVSGRSPGGQDGRGCQLCMDLGGGVGELLLAEVVDQGGVGV